MDEAQQPKPIETAGPMSANASFQVGDLLIEIGRARVTRDGQRVALPRRSFDLLLALLAAAPDVMSLDVMMKRVWPGLVVSPETVTQRVKVLRDALGDDPKNPRYIEGVRGRGYRLMAAVTPISSRPSDAPGTPPLAATPAARQPSGRWAIMVAALVVIVAIPAGYLAMQARLAPAPSIALPAAPIDSATPSIAVLPFENLSSAPDGSVVALGVSEAILHQLASLQQLLVIARTSSFAFAGQKQDAREIARRLNTRYLLEGSVQRDQSRLRVTAQLIDAVTGTHVWSIRLDRAPQDIFAVQDEIAQEVAKALQISVLAQTVPRGHRTQDVAAWLAFQQGRALVATRKIPQLEQAKVRFRQATSIDPDFAAAYVGWADAFVAEGFLAQSEFWIGSAPELSASDKAEVQQLLQRALQLDPANGDALLIRAWQEEDDSLAEADYRRGLQLSPNNAAGYAHYARLLFRAPGSGSDVFDPGKREQAFMMLDRALKLDPLAPGPYLVKALMLSYGRSDWKGAIALSLQALAQDPNYYPALMKLAEFKWAGAGELAEAVQYAEQALAQEPKAPWLRHMLSRIYLDLGEFESARSVIEEANAPDPVGQVPLELFRKHWRAAGSLAMGSDIHIPGDWELMEAAVFRAAVETGDLAGGQSWLNQVVGLKWSQNGMPVFEEADYSKEGAVLAGRFLDATGQSDRGTRVLNSALRTMDRDARELGRGDNWFICSRAEALAALGNKDAAIDTLIRGSESTFLIDFWLRVANEPAYASYLDDARFSRWLSEQHAHIERERMLLNTLRATGAIPTRVKRAEPAQSSR